MPFAPAWDFRASLAARYMIALAGVPYRTIHRTITRQDATERIREARERKGVSFRTIAQRIGRDPVWTTAALLGQMKMEAAEADQVAELLDLDEDVSRALQGHPTKGSLKPTVPTDPLIYRFYEIVQVYGTTLKALIHEEFGDGIMSAIDFEIKLERKPDPHGDRVLVTLDGKFLPYRKWQRPRPCSRHPTPRALLATPEVTTYCLPSTPPP